MREKDSLVITAGVVIVLGIITYILMVSITTGSLSSPGEGFPEHDAGAVPDGLLYAEDFDHGLSGWTLIGNPQPVIREDLGNPPPCFDNRGDDLWDNFAISTETFDDSGGLILVCDMYVNDSHLDGCWVDGLFRLARNESGGGAVMQVSYRVIGEACWGNPPEERGYAYRDFGIMNESGKFRFNTTRANEDLGKWHRYTVVIRPDRIVEFYVDSELAYRTEEKIAPSDSGLYLVIGNRSHRDFGPALIDSIRVYAYSEQTVEFLTGHQKGPDP
ncbi:MAG: hypothetical protein GKC07_00380 [Methanomicrobiales archaeon]|nr:hypothetical protein [Methanomicrobiales archaeon]